MKDKNYEVAYICDGHDDCALNPGCFMRNDPITWSDIVCRHTLNQAHAVNGICLHPEDYPDRFACFPEFEKIKYYERLPGEEL